MKGLDLFKLTFKKITKRSIIKLFIGLLLLLGCVLALNFKNIQTQLIVGSMNSFIKNELQSKYKDYEGSELYEEGILKEVDNYYTVYEVKKEALKEYDKLKTLDNLLENIKPIEESPLISRSNEILSIIQKRGSKIKEVKSYVPSSNLISMLNGSLDTKIDTIATTVNGINDLKYVRFLGYNVDIIYIDGVDIDYVLPLLSDTTAKELDMGNTESCSVDIFMEKLLLLEK